MAQYANNEPLLIPDVLSTRGARIRWYSQLKKISHWKELAHLPSPVGPQLSNRTICMANRRMENEEDDHSDKIFKENYTATKFEMELNPILIIWRFLGIQLQLSLVKRLDSGLKKESRTLRCTLLKDKEAIRKWTLPLSPNGKLTLILHDSPDVSHFGRPGHSLGACKTFDHDLVDTWDKVYSRGLYSKCDHCMAPRAQGLAKMKLSSLLLSLKPTCGIQPVHLLLPTLSRIKSIPHCRCITQTKNKGLVTRSQMYLSWSKLGSQEHTVPMKMARSTLGFGPMGHQEIRQSEPFQGAPEPGPASPRMSSQDLDITTTEEEEVHTKRTDPPPAGTSIPPTEGKAQENL
uniref:Uncharacterized protein n=1 Tax=Fagus sylvatica TaxID=28930 RepID=A0A2N9GXS5_FAGSY